MICNATHLGDFNHCEDVEIDILVGEISIRNIVTKWQCSFENGLSIGKLAPGEYITEYNEITYTFIVT